MGSRLKMATMLPETAFISLHISPQSTSAVSYRRHSNIQKSDFSHKRPACRAALFTSQVRFFGIHSFLPIIQHSIKPTPQHTFAKATTFKNLKNAYQNIKASSNPAIPSVSIERALEILSALPYDRRVFALKQDLFQELIDTVCGKEVSPKAVDDMVQSYISASFSHKALDLLQWLSTEHGAVPACLFIDAWNRYYRHLSQTNDIVGCRNLWSIMPKNEESYHIHLELMLTQNRHTEKDTLANFFSEANAECKVDAPALICTQFRCLVQIKNWESSAPLYQDVVRYVNDQLGCYGRSACQVAVLRYCQHQHGTEIMFEKASTLRSLTDDAQQFVWSYLFSDYRRHHPSQPLTLAVGLELLSSLRKISGRAPPPSAFIDLLEYSLPEAALKLYSISQQSFILPTPTLLSPLIKSKSIPLQKRFQLYLDLPLDPIALAPPLDIFLNLLEGCATHQNSPDSAEIIQQHNTALSLLTDMQALELRLPQDRNTSLPLYLADLIQTASEPSSALHIYALVYRLNPGLFGAKSFAAVLRSICQRFADNSAIPLSVFQELMKDMRSRGCPPSTDTYTSLIELYSKPQINHRPNPSRSLQALQTLHATMKMDSTLRSFDTKLQNALMQSYANFGIWQSAWQIWQSILIRIRQSKIKSYDEAFDSLRIALQTAVLARNASRVRRAWSEAVEAGLVNPRSSDALCILLDALCRCDDWAFATNVLQNSSRIDSAALVALLDHDNRPTGLREKIYRWALSNDLLACWQNVPVHIRGNPLRQGIAGQSEPIGAMLEVPMDDNALDSVRRLNDSSKDSNLSLDNLVWVSSEQRTALVSSDLQGHDTNIIYERQIHKDGTVGPSTDGS